MKRLLLGASSAVIALAAALPASAQSNASTQTVDDIVVTALRREESSQKVGLALTVISGEDLDNRNIGNVNDLENSVPSLEVDRLAA